MDDVTTNGPPDTSAGTSGPVPAGRPYLPLFGGGVQAPPTQAWSPTEEGVLPLFAQSDAAGRHPPVPAGTYGPADDARELRYLLWRAGTGRELLPYPYGHPPEP